MNRTRPHETLALTFVGTGSDLTPLSPARDSPVLLIGDSHTLIFHDPTLVARGAGLPDHLAIRLGITVDLIGVRGSGTAAAQMSCSAAEGTNLEGRELVVSVF